MLAAHPVQAIGRAGAAVQELQQRELAVRRAFFVQHGPHLPRWPLLLALDDFPQQPDIAMPDFDVELPAVTPGCRHATLHRS